MFATKSFQQVLQQILRQNYIEMLIIEGLPTYVYINVSHYVSPKAFKSLLGTENIHEYYEYTLFIYNLQLKL